jgi:hypothetical protein
VPRDVGHDLGALLQVAHCGRVEEDLAYKDSIGSNVHRALDLEPIALLVLYGCPKRFPLRVVDLVVQVGEASPKAPPRSGSGKKPALSEGLGIEHPCPVEAVRARQSLCYATVSRAQLLEHVAGCSDFGVFAAAGSCAVVVA